MLSEMIMHVTFYAIVLPPYCPTKISPIKFNAFGGKYVKLLLHSINETHTVLSIKFDEDTVKLQIDYNMKKSMEEEVIKALQKEDYTLNTANSYGENLLHISAANGCFNVIKEILTKQDSCHIIDRKNKFGWTPLMLAIRNRDINTVKLLLENNANVNESTYLGMSVLGLAAAINTDMFQTGYKVCPSALSNSANDDITPLCIAAMKNDKHLFFKLLELGCEDFKNNEYTQIMMKQSTVPEIANLAKNHLDIEDYWSDISDNIPIESDSKKEQLQVLKLRNKDKEKCVVQIMHNVQNKYDDGSENKKKVSSCNLSVKPMFIVNSPELNNKESNNNVKVDLKKYSKPCKLNLMTQHLEPIQLSLISPTLTCTFDETKPPNIYFTQKGNDNKINIHEVHHMKSEESAQCENELVIQCSKNNKCLTKPPLQRLQSIRPPDLNIQRDQDEDLNLTLGYIPEFSPVRSPHVPSDINDENVFGQNTPTPPHYKTPPRRMVLNSEDAKMYVLLKRYGLSQHVPLFIEQEVDTGLFMTLTDEDLIEIGIKNTPDRKAILNVIMDCRRPIL